ncbi:MAG: GTPase [archaeon]
MNGMKAEMEGILETAFRRARMKTAQGKKPRGIKGEKTIEIKKIEVSSEYVNLRLNDLEAKIPRISEMDPFHRELLESVIGNEKIKKSVSHLVESQKIINRVRRKCVKEIHSTNDSRKIQAIRKQFYGRMASVLRTAEESHGFLTKAASELRKMPRMDFERPRIIIAGIPNTGKSTLLKRLTRANPEIAVYPFTTKLVQMGHLEEKRGKLQLIDTPGLLDRPKEQRNEIEKRAISAIKHLASAIVFVVDPTGNCGYSIGEQSELFKSLKIEFENRFIVAINKCDIASKEEIASAKAAFEGSEITLDGNGMHSELLDRIFDLLGKKEPEGNKKY